MNPEKIAEIIAELKGEETVLKKRLNLVQMAIKTHQDLCPHTHPDGSSALVREVGIRYKRDICVYCGISIELH